MYTPPWFSGWIWSVWAFSLAGAYEARLPGAYHHTDCDEACQGMPPKRTLRPLSDRKDGFRSFGVICGCDSLSGETRIEAMFEDGAGAFCNQHAFVAHTRLSS